MENNARQLLIITQKVDLDDSNLGFFHEWIKRLAGGFTSVIVICLEKGKYELPDNVRVYSLGKDSGASKWQWILIFFKYIVRFRGQYDGVFIHMNPEYLVLGGLLWRVWKKKTLLWYTHKSVTWKLRIAEVFVDKIFTASRESFRLPSTKVEVVGHGIDTEIFAPAAVPPSGDIIRLLAVGRISPSKDLETIVRAVSKVNETISRDIILDIVGEPVMQSDEEYLSRIKQLIYDMRLEERIYFLDAKPHAIMPQVYQTHHILLHASRTGSLDKTVLEALVCGLCVLSSGEEFSAMPGVYFFKRGDVADLTQVVQTIIKRDAYMRRTHEAVEFVHTYHDLNTLIKRISQYFYGRTVNSHSSI